MVISQAIRRHRKKSVKAVLLRNIDNKKTVKIFVSEGGQNRTSLTGISIAEDPHFSFVILDEKIETSLENEIKKIVNLESLEGGSKTIKYDINERGHKLLFTFRQDRETIKATMSIVAAISLSVNLSMDDLLWFIDHLNISKMLR